MYQREEKTNTTANVSGTNSVMMHSALTKMSRIQYSQRQPMVSPTKPPMSGPVYGNIA